MNYEQIRLTQKKFPILFHLAQEYVGSDVNDIRESFRDKPALLFGEEYWLKYEQALNNLSSENRGYILEKLRKATRKLNEEKGWPHFEEILNEVLAHEFLIQNGYKNVEFIEDNVQGGPKPDLKILTKNVIGGLVEVKTIRFSDDEYKAVKKELETGEGRFLSVSVHPNLYKKVSESVEEALNQLWTYNTSSLLSSRQIYLFLNLDAGNLLDLIFTPNSELKVFLCKLKADLENSRFPKYEGKRIIIRMYVLSGRSPVEITCNG